jgi:hypothetical protein
MPSDGTLIGRRNEPETIERVVGAARASAEVLAFAARQLDARRRSDGGAAAPGPPPSASVAETPSQSWE